MKYAATVLFLTLPIALFPAPHRGSSAAADDRTGQPRAVRVQGVVDAPVSEVWRVFTTSEGAMEFFAHKANIRVGLGGPYEIQFDPKDDRSGTKGLKVLSHLPEEMISFQWNAPTEMPEVRNGETWVVVQMRPEGPGLTYVTNSHLGWKKGAVWVQACAHFIRGWSELLTCLQQRSLIGPIDWNKQQTMDQEAAAARP